LIAPPIVFLTKECIYTSKVLYRLGSRTQHAHDTINYAFVNN
jgi:hypothetical protein